MMFKFLSRLVPMLLLSAALSLPVAADVSVQITGPAGTRSQTLAGSGGQFDINMPLARNAVNTLVVTATDENGNRGQQEVSITQISFDQLVVTKVTAEPLPVERIEQLVQDGVIDLDDPDNFNVSQFAIVLTVAQKPVIVNVPVVVPKLEEPIGFEQIQPQPGSGSGRGGRIPDAPPLEIVVFQSQPARQGVPPVTGVIVIEGRIKTLKEFFSVKFLMMNVSGIFTLKDVTASLEFPDGGLSNTLPADGMAALGNILPGSPDAPGQANKEFIVRGDEIGTRGVKVNFGGVVTGPGIAEGDEVPFNGSAQTSIEVKGPPTFEVRVTHPDVVTRNEPYELIIDITNTGQTPALYASLDLDVGLDAELVKCDLDDQAEPFCESIEGPEMRAFGHILEGRTVREVFIVRPLLSGNISSCTGIADQNISLKVSVGNLGCLTGTYPPGRNNPDGLPAVAIVPSNNLQGVGLDSPVSAFFSKEMDTSTISLGESGSFKVYNPAGEVQPGIIRFAILNGDTVAVWQLRDGISNRLQPNTEYTVRLEDSIKDNEGLGLLNVWTSTFKTTGEGIDDDTPPFVSVSVDPPVDPNNVLPGQVVKVSAYASDQGSGVQRIELRIKDLTAGELLFTLIDRKDFTVGDQFPFIFPIDSRNLTIGHTYQLLATAYDGAGNPADTTYSLFVSPSAPAPSIALPDTIDDTLKGLPVTVTPTEITGGAFEVRYFLDSATVPIKQSTLEPHTLVIPTSDLAPGVHTIRAQARDGLAQSGEDTLSFTVLENNAAPSVNIDSPTPDQQVVTGSVVEVSAQIEDPVGLASITWHLNDPDAAPFARDVRGFPLDTRALPLGEYTLYVRATNSVGLSSDPLAASAFRRITIVDPPPEPPPAAPLVDSISASVESQVLISGSTVSNAKVRVTNLSLGITVEATAAADGAFDVAIDASPGDELQLVALDPSESREGDATVVEVPPPALPSSLSVNPQSLAFDAIGASQSLTVIGQFDDGGTADVTHLAAFVTAEPTVVSVDQNGTAVALGNGSAALSITVGSITLMVPVVVEAVVLQSIGVSPDELTFLAQGEMANLSVVGNFSDGSSRALGDGVVFNSNDPNIVAVDPAGQVTATGSGQATVSVAVEGVPGVEVSVLADFANDTPPEVEFLAPQNGARFEPGDLVTVQVRARDSVGGVIEIGLEVSGESMRTETRTVARTLDTTAQFVVPVPLDARLGGSVRIEARAVDSGGNTSLVAVRTVSVADKTAPTATIVSPQTDARFNAGDQVDVQILSNDLVGVVEVQLDLAGAITLSQRRSLSGASGEQLTTFSFTVPQSTLSEDVRLRAIARDAAGNAVDATPVDIFLTTADLEPPESVATNATDPGSGTRTTISYQVIAGLDDLSHVELYFRRNSIGTFNRFTNAAGGNPNGEFVPGATGSGVIEFDATQMGGDGNFEFYTIAVDTNGNRESVPVDADAEILADVQALIDANLPVTIIASDTVISATDLSFDNQNLRIDGAEVTIDGEHSFFNIELVNGAALTHSPTMTSTEGALTFSAWTMSVDQSSLIDLKGRGYLGGNKPGNNCNGDTLAHADGARFTSAGSYGGSGAQNSGATNPLYGDLTDPRELGSGGACGSFSRTGGNGGGLVIAELVNLALDGRIDADGDEGAGSSAGSGSGGGINLTVASVSGTGLIHADGGKGDLGGGGGRVAINYVDIANFDNQQVTALGGAPAGPSGGNGTVFLRESMQGAGTLVIDGQGAGTSFSSANLPDGVVFDNIVIQNSARVIIDQPVVVSNRFSVLDDSIVTHTQGATDGLVVQAAEIVVDASSAIDVSGKGYLGGNQPGNNCNGDTLGKADGAGFAASGSHGGIGTRVSSGLVSAVYGDPLNPKELGAGGACGSFSRTGGNGGGRIELQASRRAVLDGVIAADGDVGAGSSAGSGAGGSITVSTPLLRGDGVVRSHGGAGQVGGGGGRILIQYTALGGADDNLNNLRNVTSFGGEGTASDGSAGTVVLKQSDQPYGELVIDQGRADTRAQRATPLTHLDVQAIVELSDDTITVEGLVSIIPGGLVGLEINPNIGQAQTRRIVANTANTITVDISDGQSLTSMANVGDDVVLIYRFDNVWIRNGGFLILGDQLRVMNRLALSEHAELTHYDATATFRSQLDIEADSVSVDASSRIDVSLRGYLGGNQPGNNCNGDTLNFADGAQFTSAASHGGSGARGRGVTNSLYGSLTDPRTLGAGGSCGSFSRTGGDGGGRVGIVARSVVVDGVIAADGDVGAGSSAGSGAGGSIRVQTSVISGSGAIHANGGAGEFGGGGGRIAIDYGLLGMDSRQFAAASGLGANAPGGAGTIVLRGLNEPVGTLIIDGLDAPADFSQLPFAGLQFSHILVRRGARVLLDEAAVVSGEFSVSESSVVSHSQGQVDGVAVDAAIISIDSSSQIDTTGKGYLGGNQPGNNCNGDTLGMVDGSSFTSGGSHGGLGGGNESVVAPVYGDPLQPDALGAGGSCGSFSQPGGNGGGRITLLASEQIVVDGVLSADGGESGTSSAGSGAGGSIVVDSPLLRGQGLMRAHGGAGQQGGGGGRILVDYEALGDVGDDFDAMASITAYGGEGSVTHGSAGTVVIRDRLQAFGTLRIDQGKTGERAALATPLPHLGFQPIVGLDADTIMTNQRVRMVPGGMVGLEINPNVEQDQTYRIVSNTTNTITVDLAGGSALTSLAAIGDRYAVRYRFDNVVLSGGGYMVLGDMLSVTDTYRIEPFSELTHYETTNLLQSRIDLETGTLDVAASGRINVDGRGYLGGSRPGNNCNGDTLEFADGANFGIAASHGGQGVVPRSGNTNAGYGDASAPDALGSGGGCGSFSQPGGDGGGNVQIEAIRVVLDGEISANGAPSESGGAGSGSGGSVYIQTASFSGSGSIHANGGDGAVAGGGGRVAVDFASDDFDGAISALGGTSGVGDGGNGSVVLAGSTISGGTTQELESAPPPDEPMRVPLPPWALIAMALIVAWVVRRQGAPSASAVAS